MPIDLKSAGGKVLFSRLVLGFLRCKYKDGMHPEFLLQSKIWEHDPADAMHITQKRG